MNTFLFKPKQNKLKTKQKYSDVYDDDNDKIRDKKTTTKTTTMMIINHAVCKATEAERYKL